MTDQQILEILQTKPHNPKYLNLYIRYIKRCKKYNVCNITLDCKHHILPKAKSDMFPEYKNFNKHKWNLIWLTNVQHFRAHYILYKAFSGSQLTAFNRMCKNGLVSAAEYNKIRIKQSIKASATQKRLIELGDHIFQQEVTRKNNSIRQSAAMINGSHIWCTESIKEKISLVTTARNNKDVLNGNHPFQTQEFRINQSKRITKRNKQLSALGKHPSQTQEYKEMISKNVTIKNSISSSRTNVIRLKELIKSLNIKLGHGWYKKSDLWIDNKILELLSL